VSLYVLPVKPHLLSRLAEHYTINRQKQRSQKPASSAIRAPQRTPMAAECESVGELGNFIKQCVLSVESGG
jgi:hypothetical protein